MTDKELAQLIEDLHVQLRGAASIFQQLEDEVIRLRAHGRHAAAEGLEHFVARRSALLSDQTWLKPWRQDAAVEGRRL